MAEREVLYAFRSISSGKRSEERQPYHDPMIVLVVRLASKGELDGGRMRAGVYARVSTTDQHCENQLQELRRYCEARQWPISREYVDQGVSAAKERRPALDELVKDAKRRRFDVLVVWRLDRLGRNLRHLMGQCGSLNVGSPGV